MLWQAESGFGFRLAGGYLYPLVADGPSLTGFDDDPTVEALNFRSDTAPPRMTSLLAFAGSHGIDRFVAVDGAGYPSAAADCGRSARCSGSAACSSPRACGSAPLTSRDLDRYVGRPHGAGRDDHLLPRRELLRSFPPASTRPA